MAVSKESDYLNSISSKRYFAYSHFIKSLKELLSGFKNDQFSFEEIGSSVCNESVFKVELGNGSIRILIWSQMHGNESTTTRALLPFIKWFTDSEFSSYFKLYIIPVLNPDGFLRWTRENANNVDLNRDAQHLSQPESRILRAAFDSFKPHYCFNLHDQRTIYGTIDGSNAVQCSFLAPAADVSRSITTSRLTAMQIINAIVKILKNQSTGVIGRYGDAFNNNCVGDTFQALEVPTVLFEAGHAGLDYHRVETVQLMIQSLKTALKAIMELKAKGLNDKVVQEYQQIPTIATNFCDVLVKNVPSITGNLDLAIMYREILENDILYFVPVLVGINDISVKNAHRVIDLKGEEDVVDFEITVEQRFISYNLDIVIFY